jgi:hypothetical protein
MTPPVASRIPHKRERSIAPRPRRRLGVRRESQLEYAIRVMGHICCLAGSSGLLDEVRDELRDEGVISAIKRDDSRALFDWLMVAFSYQGISDRVATEYMAQHGRVHWKNIRHGLAQEPACPKLKSYWHFYSCRYDKGSQTCAEPEFIRDCPLPTHHLRNGRLNQTAYSLHLFIRDVADGDLIGWIDRQLTLADEPHDERRPARLAAALIEPLREVYGVSDKVLAMTLSCVLLGAPKRPVWLEAGGAMIAIDTLVHNFMHRTGILRRCGAEHAYGSGCYRTGGCADLIALASKYIDARAFNAAFPAVFPRFVQHAIWRYCAQLGLNICNGNRIDDRKSCDNVYCQIYSICGKVSLYK